MEDSMKSAFLAISLVFLAFVFTTEAQNKRKLNLPIKKISAAKSVNENPNTAVVVDERLAVLRSEPSLYARSIQRMRRGRILAISGVKQADGVTFYRVIVPPNNYGWVQAEAVVTKRKKGDDERLARLVQVSEGFEQIERAVLYLESFPNSALSPAILLLLGDLAEENALKLSGEATRRLDRREMGATGAPLHSFYLNYAGLDRYRKLNINFLFNSGTKKFHFDGASWNTIISKFPKSSEVEEAKKRLDSLKEKMIQTTKQ
jgi:hypothetical protein